MDFKNYLLSMFYKEDEHYTLMIIKHKLDTGEINVNDAIDWQRNTLLHLACSLDKLEIVQYLIKRSANVNATNHKGATPLHAAIMGGNIPLVKLLLDNGSCFGKISNYVNHNPDYGFPGIMYPIAYSSLEMIKLLFDYGTGIDINFRFTIKEDEIVLTLTPLDYAIRHCRIDVVQFLINNGANVNVVIPELNDTPLHTISRMNIEENKSCEIAELLIESGANLNVKNKDELYPLNHAIILKNVPLIELLVKSGSDLSLKLNNNIIPTSFHFIISDINNPKCIDLCLKNGADYGIIGKNGFSAYHLALLGSNSKQTVEVIQKFWQHGCPYDLSLGNTYSKSIKRLLRNCLHGSDGISSSIIKYQKMMFKGIQCNDVKTVKNAIKSGAVARGTSMDIKYPLHFVSSKGYTQVAQVLLENGIKVNSLNNKNETALQLAIKFRKINICKLLFKHGACLNFKDEIRNLDLFDDEPSKEMKELLMSICNWFHLVKQGHCVIFELMKDLLESDENLFLSYLNALDKNKRSLMALAMYYGHGEIVEEMMNIRLLCKRNLLKLPEL